MISEVDQMVLEFPVMGTKAGENGITIYATHGHLSWRITFHPCRRDVLLHGITHVLRESPPLSCSARQISRDYEKGDGGTDKKEYGLDRMPETGNEYPLRVFFYKDQVTVGIDTSGESLHKRGYRQMTSKAPITETLAAALILLTPWKGTGFWSIRSAEAVLSQSRRR